MTKFLTAIAIIIIFTSCANTIIVKRKHRSGFHVQLFEKNIKTNNTIITRCQNFSATNERIGNAVISVHNDEFKNEENGNAKITGHIDKFKNRSNTSPQKSSNKIFSFLTKGNIGNKKQRNTTKLTKSAKPKELEKETNSAIGKKHRSFWFRSILFGLLFTLGFLLVGGIILLVISEFLGDIIMLTLLLGCIITYDIYASYQVHNDVYGIDYDSKWKWFKIIVAALSPLLIIPLTLLLGGYLIRLFSS